MLVQENTNLQENKQLTADRTPHHNNGYSRCREKNSKPAWS